MSGCTLDVDINMLHKYSHTEYRLHSKRFTCLIHSIGTSFSYSYLVTDYDILRKKIQDISKNPAPWPKETYGFSGLAPK